MLHDRGTDPWEAGVRAQHVTKVLYKLWNDAGVKARQIVAAISLPGNLVLCFGRLPIAILEQGHMDLLGCWNSDRSPLSPLDCLYWTNSTTVSEWCLISDALIESYRSHTDMNQGASYRSIVKSALGCKGTNTSIPVTEGRGEGFKLAGLLTGVTCGIGKHVRGNDHNAKVVLAEHATLYLDKSKPKELEAGGFKLSAKGQASTKGVLKVHLASQDHPGNLANLDDFRTGPAYEYAKKIMMSCSWTDENIGTPGLASPCAQVCDYKFHFQDYVQADFTLSKCTVLSR
jgi:hypothetical protein